MIALLITNRSGNLSGSFWITFSIKGTIQIALKVYQLHPMSSFAHLFKDSLKTCAVRFEEIKISWHSLSNIYDFAIIIINICFRNFKVFSAYNLSLNLNYIHT